MIRPFSLGSTVFAIGLVASCLAGCGSSPMAPDDDGTPAVGADRIPDEQADPSLRNDCFAISGKVLASNVGDASGDGPISRFVRTADRDAWTPIVGTTRESVWESGSIARAWSAPGQRDPKPACAALTAMFSTAGAMDGEEQVRFATRVEHRVVDFAYPQDLASAPTVGQALPVKVTSTLRIDFERPWRRADGTIDPDMHIVRDEEAQAWPLEVTCKKPFTVTPVFEERSAMPTEAARFCKPREGGAECLTYRFDYAGDECSFVARDTTVRTLAGETVKVTFAGVLERQKREGQRGYSLRVTNWELR
jgi:hypothetical protein